MGRRSRVARAAEKIADVAPSCTLESDTVVDATVLRCDILPESKSCSTHGMVRYFTLAHTR